MKAVVLFICCAAQMNLIATFKIIPDYLPQPCSKSVQNYNECTFEVLNKTIPLLLKGVRELNIPQLVPLEIPVLAVNKSLCEYLSIFAVLKDVEVWGLDSIKPKNFKLDTESLIGELRLTVPHKRILMNYDVTGRLLTYDLNCTGVLQVNATNTDMTFKFSLKQTEKLGVNYYAFEDVNTTISVEDFHVKIISQNKHYQIAANVVASFLNEDRKRTIDAVKPLCEEAKGLFFRSLAEQILKTVPANELIPE